MILNGPNLNLLGKRQPEIYGVDTLHDMESSCLKYISNFQMSMKWKQSNFEGQLIDWIQEANSDFDGLIINPGAYSHTSMAIMDALLAVKIPIIEVRLSNIHARDAMRHSSITAKAAAGVICGLGGEGYQLALQSLYNKLTLKD